MKNLMILWSVALLTCSFSMANSTNNIRKDFFDRFETLQISVREADQYAHLLVLMEMNEEDRRAMLDKLMEAENIINKVRSGLIDKYNELPIKIQRMIKMKKKKN